tara:strand:- start:5730 stop:6473 length:744 start_codon:yes stop_codon:yes gene_type:complete
MVNSKKINKGIILAGGHGTRLRPLTSIISKQLLPIYDKPMIYYPLQTLINAGINDILIITTDRDQKDFINLLGNGEEFDVTISYKTQEQPEGIAHALIISEDWIKDERVTLILGDNLFFGPSLNDKIIKNINNSGATIFCIESNEPERFGVIKHDKNHNIQSITEKPNKPESNWIVTGLYIYDENAVSYAKTLKKSERGEFEITDLNSIYLDKNKLKAEFLDDSYSWLDTGTFDTLLEANNFVKNLN